MSEWGVLELTGTCRQRHGPSACHCLRKLRPEARASATGYKNALICSMSVPKLGGWAKRRPRRRNAAHCAAFDV